MQKFTNFIHNKTQKNSFFVKIAQNNTQYWHYYAKNRLALN